jgi:thiamine transport system permease protein
VKLTAAAIAGVLALLLVILAFAAPLPAAFAPLFAGSDWGGVFGLNEFIHMITGGRFRAIVGFTLAQAAGSTCIAVLLGIPGAFLIARRKFPGKRFFSALSAVPLCVPPLLIALGFTGFYGMQGIFNRFLMNIFSLEKPPITFLYSFWGIIIAHGFYDFPVIMRITGELWARQSREEIDAARILGAGKFRIFRTITLFHLAPAIGAGAVLVFLYCFFSFVIVLMFGSVGVSTIEVEIYQAARTDMNYPLAAALGITETMIALTAVTLYGRLESRAYRTSSNTTGYSPLPQKPLLSAPSSFLFSPSSFLSSLCSLLPALCYLLLILLFFLAPLFSIVWNSFTASGTG